MSNKLTEILAFVASLGVNIERGTPERPWVKAGCLFVQHYVVCSDLCPNLSNKEIEVMQRTVSQQLFTNLVTNSTDGSNQGKKLPCRKTFISVKKLHERYSTPAHGHITQGCGLLSGEKTTCSFRDWPEIQSVLIGKIDVGDDGKLEYLDNSGKIQCYITSLDSKYVGAVCLLRSWNYIPRSKLCKGFLEVLSAPTVLSNLKSPADLSMLNTISVKSVLETQDGFFTNAGLNISGFLHKFECQQENSFCCFYLIPNRLELDCLSLTSCHTYPGNLICIKCAEIKNAFYVMQSGYQVTFHNLFQDLKSRPTKTFNFSKDTIMDFTSDEQHLHKLYEQNTDCLSSVKWEGKLGHQYAFCTLYIGAIEEVLLREIRLIKFTDGVYASLIRSRSNFSPLRQGCVIALKAIHAFKNKETVFLMCCESSHVQILRHSKLLPKLGFITPNIHSPDIHPVHLACLSSMVHKWSLSQLDFKMFLHVVGNPKACANDSGKCPVAQMVKSKCSSPQLLSVKDIKEKAMDMAISHFNSENKHSDYWRLFVVSLQDLLGLKTKKSFLIGKIQISKSGFFEVTDLGSSISCVVLPASYKQPGTQNELSSHYAIVSNDLVGSLCIFENFLVVVESCVNSHPTPAPVQSTLEACNAEFEIDCMLQSQNRSIVYLMFCEQNIFKLASKENLTVQVQASPVAKSQYLNRQSILMFVTHKGPLLKFAGISSFDFSSYNFTFNDKLEQCHLQFCDQASSWYDHVLPGLLFLIHINGKEGPNTTSSSSRTTNAVCSCDVIQILKWDDLPGRYHPADVKSFYKKARSTWKAGFYSQGLEPVFGVAELVVRPPPSDRHKLVAVRGRVVNRISYLDYGANGEQSTRVDMTDESGQRTLSVYFASYRSASPILGLLPGNVLCLYRVKLVVSKKGHVYCKYTPTSFHVLEASQLFRDVAEAVTTSDASLSEANETKDSIEDRKIDGALQENPPDNFDQLPTPLTTLYRIYLSDQQQSYYRLKAQILRVLTVRFAQLCTACGRERADCDGCRSPAVNTEEMTDIGFEAKTMISDGTGRAILYFTHHNHETFCALLGISPPEWTELTSLVRETPGGLLEYDCSDVDDRDHIFPRYRQPEEDREILLVRSLFHHINSSCFLPRLLLLRRQPESRKRTWKTAQEDDQIPALIDDGLTNSKFGLTSFSLDGSNQPSVTSLGMRLLQFNCAELA